MVAERSVQVSSIIFAELGIILVIAGLASTPWRTNVADGKEEWNGLWDRCIAFEGSNGGNCTNLSNVEAWLQATRSLTLISVIVIMPALVLVLVLGYQNRKRLQLLSASSLLAAIICCIGLIVYAVKSSNSMGDLDWAFYISWVGVFFCACAFAVAVYAQSSFAAEKRAAGWFERDPIM